MNIVILSPHTDDGEIGCGGTISKLIKQGHTIYYVAFSAAEKSVLPTFPKNILRTEVKKATKILGINKENVIVLDFEVRSFPEYRQDILEEMVKISRDIRPDLVFLPSGNDTHQDHNVIFNEGFRAFKGTTMLGYEIPWNNPTFTTNVFFVLDKKDIENKMLALNQYQSQSYRQPDLLNYLEHLACVRGGQIKTGHAEAFECIRLVIKDNNGLDYG